jgi:uncharacterized protein (DUF362 family)
MGDRKSKSVLQQSERQEFFQARQSQVTGHLAGRSDYRLPRRELLKTAVTLGLGAVAGCGKTPTWKPSAYRKAPSSRVAIVKAASYASNLTQLVVDGIKLCGLVVKGKRVLLKPNLVEYESDTVINTNPALIGAAIEAFLRLGAREVRVGEGPGHRRDTDGLLIASGLLPYLEGTRTPFTDLNLDDMRRVSLQSTFMGIESLFFSETVLSTDLLVSLPKLKTHHWAGMTLSMKNLFGIVPGVKYGWPKNFLHWHGIDQSIVDINSTVRPHFAIVDGIVGMEGNGPIQGKPKPCGVLVFGDDPVAVDATCTRIAGLKPEEIKYLASAGEFLGNLEEGKIQQIGEAISTVRVRFEVIDSFKHLKA